MRRRMRRLLAMVLVLMLISSDLLVIAETLATLKLPSSLQVIEEEAFYGDKSIEKVVVPEGTTEIHARAFAKSTLKEIELPASLVSIAEDAFEDCGEFSVIVPKDCYAYDWAVENGYITPETTVTPVPTEMPTSEPTLEPTAFSALVDCNAKESFVGQTVIWTASAVNGLAPYKYMFKLYRGASLLATRAYSEDSTYTYTFTEPGEYYVVLSVKDDNRKVVSVQSDTIMVGLEKLMVSDVSCNMETFQTTETVTWTATAAGGQAPYVFAFTLIKDKKVIAEQVYSEAETFSYEFVEEGDYVLEIKAKDTLNVESEVYELAIPVALRSVEITSLTANVSSGQTEEAITWTVEAFAGQAPYTYAFEVILDGVSQGKSKEQTENVYSYMPELAGTYKVIAYVTDAYGNVAQLESSELAVTTKPLAVFSVTADKDWVKVGDTVTWSTTAIGGVKPLRYAFDVYVDGEELDGCAFTAEKTISYAPDMTGVYSVNALVRDAENTTVSVVGGEVTAYAQIAVNSVTADVSECLTGEPVTWTANVTGGKGTLSYYYEVYCGDTLEYVTTSAENTLLYAPMHSDTYTVKTRVTDENGEHSELTGGEIAVSLHASSPVEDFTFNTLNGTYCEITGYTGTDVAIVLPEADSEGHIVQNIASNAFKNNTTICSVVIPDCVETMDSNVFYGCRNLLTVIGGAELTNIGNYAFYNCTSLKNYSFCKLTATLGGYAFYGCTSLQSFEGWDGLKTIGERAFADLTGLRSVSLPEGLTSIGYYSFGSCASLESIDLPNSITMMHGRAFDGCTKLSSVNYPTGWIKKDTSHGSYSPFTNCPKLTNIVVPEGVTQIPDYTFYGMTSLKTIELPSALETIGSYAFYGCTGLASVEFPEELTMIGNYAFDSCTGMTSIVIPEGVMSIPEHAFYGCTGLRSVSLPEGLTSIGYYSFGSCASLESIDLPNGITMMHGRAFDGCTKLSSVNYPTGWIKKDTSHGSYSPFTNCPKLTNIVVPEGVTQIPDYTFYGMTSLKTIELPSTLETIGSYAFYGCSDLDAIYIGPNVTTIGSNAFTNHHADLVIYGESGSYAETYASEQGITFSTGTMARTFGSLSGTVVDDEGNAVSGVTVALSPYGSYDVEFNATTNDAGKWSISEIPVGYRYQANYSAEGYAFASNNPVYMAVESGRDVGTVVATAIDTAALNSISLSITKWTGSSEDAQRYFSVDSTGDWYVESVPEWATVYSQNTTEAEASSVRMRARTVTTSSTEAVLILENNDNMTTRSGELVISNGLATATMTITQLPETYEDMSVQFAFPEAESMAVDIPAELTFSVEAANFMYGVLTVVSPDGGTEEFEFSEGTAEIPYTFRTEGDYTVYATVYGNDIWLDAGDGEERPSVQTEEYTITCSNTSSESVATQISDAGFELIKSFEGFSATPYKDGKTNQKDANGNVLYHYSIGYGCQIEGLYTADNPPEQTITREEASELLKKKIAVREATANKYLNKYGITLNQSQYDAIMSICYNFTPEYILGTDTSIRKMLIEYKNGSNIPAWKVYRTFVLYHHVNGVDNVGLFQRRMTEANIFVKGDYDTRSWNYVTEGADGWFRVPDSDGVIRRGLGVPEEWYKDKVTDSLTLSATALNVGKNGGEKGIAISGSTAWTARADSDWIIVDKTSSSYGTGKTLVMQIAANQNDSQRTGRVVVHDTKKNISQTLIVVQEGSASTTMSATIVPFDVGYTGTTKIGRGATFITTASGGDGEYSYSFKVQKLDAANEYVDYELASKYVSIQGGRIVVRADTAGYYRIVADVKDGQGQSVVVYGYFNVNGLDPIVYDADFADGNYYDINEMPTVRWKKISDAAYYRVKLVELAYAGTDDAHYVIPENGIASDEGILVTDPSISLSKYTFKKSQTYRMWVGAFNSYGIRIAQSEWIFSTNPLQEIDVELSVCNTPLLAKVPLSQDVTISWKKVETPASLNRETAFLRANVKDNTDGVWLQSVKGACARMSPEQTSFIISSKELLPGHHYTLWLAAFTKEGARFAQCKVDFYVASSVMEDGTEIITNLVSEKSSSATENYVNQYINWYVSKDILQEEYLAKDKSIVFMFEGAGALANTSRRQNALCVVVRLNDNGLPEIVYENNNSSTIPDQPKYTYTYTGTDGTTYTQDCGTVPDGIYEITTVNHNKYGALDTSARDAVRFNTGSGINGYESKGSGYHVHGRISSWVATGTNESANSKGCILIGISKAEQYEFMLRVLGKTDEPGNGYYPAFREVGTSVGCIIIDRTNAASYLTAIYGEEGAKKISPNAFN